jgi:hypothetical protein
VYLFCATPLLVTGKSIDLVINVSPEFCFVRKINVNTERFNPSNIRLDHWIVSILRELFIHKNPLATTLHIQVKDISLVLRTLSMVLLGENSQNTTHQNRKCYNTTLQNRKCYNTTLFGFSMPNYHYCPFVKETLLVNPSGFFNLPNYP